MLLKVAIMALAYKFVSLRLSITIDNGVQKSCWRVIYILRYGTLRPVQMKLTYGFVVSKSQKLPQNGLQNSKDLPKLRVLNE
jgi:hypothetical protein